jgi:hypothetical protein
MILIAMHMRVVALWQYVCPTLLGLFQQEAPTQNNSRSLPGFLSLALLLCVAGSRE